MATVKVIVEIYGKKHPLDLYFNSYYTFSNLFSDFMFFVKEMRSTDFATGFSRKWTMEYNANLVSNDMMCKPVKDIYTTSDKIFFRNTVEGPSSPEPTASRIICSEVFNNFMYIHEHLRAGSRRTHDLLSSLLRAPPVENPLDILFRTSHVIGNLNLIEERLSRSYNELELDLERLELEDVKVTFKDENFDELPEIKADTNIACGICLDNFESEVYVKDLTCKHQFHLDCLRPWLTKESTKCPTCRKCLIEDESKKEHK